MLKIDEFALMSFMLYFFRTKAYKINLQHRFLTSTLLSSFFESIINFGLIFSGSKFRPVYNSVTDDGFLKPKLTLLFKIRAGNF